MNTMFTRLLGAVWRDTAYVSLATIILLSILLADPNQARQFSAGIAEVLLPGGASPVLLSMLSDGLMWRMVTAVPPSLRRSTMSESKNKRLLALRSLRIDGGADEDRGKVADQTIIKVAVT